MTQATDGNWYAYFASYDHAVTANENPTGIDFGRILPDANDGKMFSDADGDAWPAPGFDFNVIREPKTRNANNNDHLPNDMWPFVQLYTFSNNVTVQLTKVVMCKLHHLTLIV